MKKLLLMAAALLAASASGAQVANYAFRQTVEPFIAVDQLPGAVVRSLQIGDDFVLPERVGLPFTFRLGGQLFDSVNINANGYLWFGPNIAANLSREWPISTQHPALMDGVISPLGIDLSVRPGTTLKTAVSGAAPFRTFVIEWGGTARYDPVTPGPMEGDTMTFQALLYESLQRVEIRYGRIELNPVINTDAEVGLRGSNGGDFSNRTGAWAATAKGAFNSSRIALSLHHKPAPGLALIWDVPAPASVGQLPPDAGIRLFPIPATDRLMIVGPADQWAQGAYRILDGAGKVIRSGDYADGFVPVADLPAGHYVLLLQSGPGSFTRPFIKS